MTYHGYARDGHNDNHTLAKDPLAHTRTSHTRRRDLPSDLSYHGSAFSHGDG